MWCAVARFHTAVQARIVELSAQQGRNSARAQQENAAIQAQIDALIQIDAALTANPALEQLYLTAQSLNLRIEE